MADQDPALSQEADPEDGNAATPPAADDQVETEELETGDKEDVQTEQQDDQEAFGLGKKKALEAEEQIEIRVDGEEPPLQKDSAPTWVKDLRKEHRELKAQKAELERRLAERDGASAPNLNEEPTLDNCGYDEPLLKSRWKQWNDRQQETQKAQQAWQVELQGFAVASEAFAQKVPDAKEAYSEATAILSAQQVAAIVRFKGSDAPPIFYAIGQHPGLAKDLAAETDIIKLLSKVSLLEKRVTVVSKKTPPPPEKPVKGTGSVAGRDTKLEQLEADAERTGNRTKLFEYKQRLQQKG